MATRGTWNVSRKIDGTWTPQSTGIYRPNNDFAEEQISNQVKVILADGSYAYIVPETKSNPTSLKMSWTYLPKTYKDQIDGYVTNLYDLKITDHNSTVYYGRFINSKSNRLVGTADMYDVSAEFELMPSIA
jgi:hypothetical protein